MSLEISKDVYFDCARKQLNYITKVIDYEQDKEVDNQQYVNRYVIVREDTGKELGIHTDDYIIRPYSKLAESVNEVVRECVDVDKYHCWGTPKDLENYEN